MLRFTVLPCTRVYLYNCIVYPYLFNKTTRKKNETKRSKSNNMSSIWRIKKWQTHFFITSSGCNTVTSGYNILFNKCDKGVRRTKKNKERKSKATTNQKVFIIHNMHPTPHIFLYALPSVSGIPIHVCTRSKQFHIICFSQVVYLYIIWWVYNIRQSFHF